MKILGRILFALNILFWGGLSFSGLRGMRRVAAQHASGYPNSGQAAYYLWIPLCLLVAISLSSLVVLRQGRESIAAILFAITLVMLPFYLFYYTGGM